MSEQAQAKFEGWAVVEMMGHRREVGYVTTEHYGAASLFRVDSPELLERDHALERPQWLLDRKDLQQKMCPAGTKVRREAVPARSCLVGPASIYAINPCTEEMARRAIERMIERPLIILELPENGQPKLTTGAAVTLPTNEQRAEGAAAASADEPAAAASEARPYPCRDVTCRLHATCIDCNGCSGHCICEDEE